MGEWGETVGELWENAGKWGEMRENEENRGR